MSLVCIYSAVSFADAAVREADLSFHFACPNRSLSIVEANIERFLRREGFKVFNKGRIQKEHSIYLFDLEIFGLDERHRILTFHSLPPVEGQYTVRLNTPPPTIRATKLEDDLLKFVAETLRCDVREVSRGMNGAGAAAFHNHQVERIEDYFRQAERLRGERRL